MSETDTAYICCEGPQCNGGQSAQDRERTLLRGLPAQNAETRDESMRAVHQAVSRALAVTHHARCGVSRAGTLLFACGVCGHERSYGGRMYFGM